MRSRMAVNNGIVSAVLVVTSPLLQTEIIGVGSIGSINPVQPDSIHIITILKHYTRPANK